MFKKFCIALLLLAICIPAFAQIENFAKVRIVDFSGGQNSKSYADKLTNSQGAYIANAIINIPGQITTRLGQGMFNIDTNSSAFQGITRMDIASGPTSYLITASGSSIVRSLLTDTHWTTVNSGKPITTGISVNFIQANNLLFVMDGQDATSWYDGNAGYTKGGTWPGSVSPPVAKTAAWLGNYLMLAGNPTNGDWVYFSDNLQPTSFQANQVIIIQSGSGQVIQRLEPYRTGDVIVYEDRSIYDLNISGSGSTTCTPQPICQFSYTQIVKDVGTPAPRSVVSLGNDQWFLSSAPFAIRSVTRSQFDKTFVNMMSQPIQDIFDGTGATTINSLQISKASAVYFDNKYIIAIPTGASSVNNLVCVYDFITQSWYVITGWYPASWIVYANNLYYADANDGRVVQCFTGTTGDIGTTAPASGPTVGIDFQYISKLYDFDQPDNFKQLDSLGLEFQPSGNYSVTISLNFDNAGWQVAGTIPLVSLAPTLPQTLPFTLSSPGLTYSTLQLTKFGRFKKVQVKVELNSASEVATLQKFTIFARVQPWQREP